MRKNSDNNKVVYEEKVWVTFVWILIGYVLFVGLIIYGCFHDPGLMIMLLAGVTVMGSLFGVYTYSELTRHLVLQDDSIVFYRWPLKERKISLNEIEKVVITRLYSNERWSFYILLKDKKKYKQREMCTNPFMQLRMHLEEREIVFCDSVDKELTKEVPMEAEEIQKDEIGAYLAKVIPYIDEIVKQALIESGYSQLSCETGIVDDMSSKTGDGGCSYVVRPILDDKYLCFKKEKSCIQVFFEIIMKDKTLLSIKNYEEVFQDRKKQLIEGFLDIKEGFERGGIVVVDKKNQMDLKDAKVIRGGYYV